MTPSSQILPSHWHIHQKYGVCLLFFKNATLYGTLLMDNQCPRTCIIHITIAVEAAVSHCLLDHTVTLHGQLL